MRNKLYVIYINVYGDTSVSKSISLGTVPQVHSWEFFFFFLERERVSTRGGEGKRERERESEAGSALSAEPNAGLSFMTLKS